MSTNNFYYNNILFAGHDYEDDTEGLAVQDTIGNIACDLKAIFPKGYLDKENSSYFTEDVDSLSSYGSQVICTIEAMQYQHERKEIDKTYYIQVVLRGGYYGDFNVDINYIEEDNFYSEQRLVNEPFEVQLKKIDNAMAKTQRKIEKVLKDYLTPLNHVGTMSNGEAVYRT